MSRMIVATYFVTWNGVTKLRNLANLLRVNKLALSAGELVSTNVDGTAALSTNDDSKSGSYLSNIPAYSRQGLCVCEGSCGRNPRMRSICLLEK